MVTPAAAPPCSTLAAAVIDDLIAEQLTDAVAATTTTNQGQARLWASLAELMRLARSHPEVYLRPAGIAHPDIIALAQDAAAFDAGLRLNLSTGQVRTLAHQGQTLAEQLPQLHAAFTAGATSVGHVTAALELITGWTDPAGIARFDELLAGPAETLTVTAFRAKARRVKEKLFAEPAEARHARAFAARRVWVEKADDGMAWINIHTDAADAVRIIARLNATARAEQKKAPIGTPGWRSRDQIRTDLAVAWLAGDGTPTAAKVRPVLLVPMLSLLGEGDEPIELRGYGSIDRASAARLFTDAPSFRRVATDPFTSEKLDYDRTRYRPTKAQRDWITIRHEACIDPNCSRPATDSDVDHLQEWVRDNGPSNAENLFPLCETSNRRKNLSRFDYRRLPDGRVSIHTPTGLDVTTDEAPF